MKNNQFGFYDDQQREYVVNLTKNEWTPRPWSNIITNKNFGTLITTAGASFTWFLNSALFRLTPWVNDVVTEEGGESIYLTDELTSETWSPTQLPLREKEPYEIHHGLGYSTFFHTSHQLVQKIKIFVHPNKPIKYIEITLRNLDKLPKKISLSYYCQWVLGDFPDQTKRFLWTGLSLKKDAVITRVLGNDYRSKYTAFLTCSRPQGIKTILDRAVFFGHKTSNDPCGAIVKEVDILPGKQFLLTFCLGVAKNEELEQNIAQIHKELGNDMFQQGQDYWQRITKEVQVSTPDHDLDNLFNDRLIYQTLTSRLWGRVGMYQPGGAYGFRDQLQDSLALTWSQPELTKEHILRAAAQQYRSGEVQQWWHPPDDFGAISTSSDTPLWLAYVACKYSQITGDESIFSEKVSYLNDQEQKSGTLYEHCLLAIERTLSLTGAKGLPLMLSGDWNDSLDNVGRNKKGESVWLSLFLSYVLNNFAAVCEAHDETDKAGRFRKIARKQAELVMTLAWGNNQFVRAFTDKGEVVGTQDNDYLQIDSIVQSWSVICGLIDGDLAQKAMISTLAKLVDKSHGLVKLLAPPIPAEAEPYLGYIQQYPEGVRENGGFYCHAAVWVVWALALSGEGNSAKEIVDMINPLKRTNTQEGLEKYMVEPYVLTSDISAGKFKGRGGWSWYTGSAAILYLVLLEEVFGLKVRGKTLIIDPCLPKYWGEFEIRYHNYEIRILNPNNVCKGVKEVILDGVKLPRNKVILVQDGKTHLVKVYMDLVAS